MTRLSVTSVLLPAAELGPDNPLPPLTRSTQPMCDVDGLPPDMAENIRYGRLDNVLPYLMQDSYDRVRVPRPIPALVLANSRLRATVLPSLGGRLYSLVDLATGRELLHRNDVLQPANLALRDAWFAGGVEWNLGSTGHTTLTCAPMHAARVDGPDGTPVLRLWEWERTRDLPYQLDFWLPPDSAFLYVGVRIRNPHAHDVPVYWWSNTAVPETPSTRVLAPASQAWQFGYSSRLDLIPVPGEDVTHPAGHRAAMDLFFDLPTDRQPWIAAVDGTGEGLLQTSTGLLRGRKLFVWGQDRGGRRWQEWLSPTSGPYLEIQAGLARTQLEHLRLPAGHEWDWLEAYGPVSVRSGQWDEAVDEAESQIPVLPEYTGFDTPPAEDLFTGSGWGALELERAAISLPGTPFPPSTLRLEQAPWLSLLDGAMPSADPTKPPGCTLISTPWRELLAATPENWLTAYHLGVSQWAAGDLPEARRSWERSVELTPNAWALRNLGRHREALKLAWSLPLLLEAASNCSPAEALELIDGHTEGRFALLRARALLALGDAAGAQAVFDEGFEIPGLGEGEETLTETWQSIQAALGTSRDLPAHYDFRMSTTHPS
jgi:tetratricopeptide (TPR) repeat protein